MDNIGNYLLGSVSIAIVVLVGIVLIVSLIFLLIVVGLMADQRGRSVAGWILIALFISTPFIAIICLFCLGDTDKRRIQRITQEEKVRFAVRNEHDSKINVMTKNDW
jgi:ABC-type arginine/histidine transport system permease subunit